MANLCSVIFYRFCVIAHRIGNYGKYAAGINGEGHTHNRYTACVAITWERQMDHGEPWKFPAWSVPMWLASVGVSCEGACWLVQRAGSLKDG